MTMSTAYVLDLNDPKAPTLEQWSSMSEDDQRRAVDSLPSEFPRTHPPEGDRHRIPKERALESLREYFRRLRRRVYLSSELPVYYPGERVFAPDVVAVLDVEPHPRERWVVSHERRGLDFALEVHVSGNRTKDLEENVTRYAKLGIPEYFVFEPLRSRLFGYRLLKERSDYQPIVPQEGRWASSVLGLELAMEGGRIRFYHGSAPLPEAEELIVRLGAMIEDVVTREEEIARQLEAERQRADEAASRAEEAASRAEEAGSRADEAASRAERLAARLRELGVDPD
jgi:Uma2 family endonuclease